MKKQLIKIFVLVILLLLSMLVLEKIIGFGLLNNRNLKMVDVQLAPKNVDLLIHGPCEPLWMISPALLDPLTGMSSYNLSLSHSDFADNYIHLYWYLKHNKAPQYLWLYVTPESFDLRFNTFNSFRFAAYLNDSLVHSVVMDMDPEYEKWSGLPLMQYSYYSKNTLFNALQGYKHCFSNRKQAYYPDGFEPPAKRVWGNHNGVFVELYDQYINFKMDPLRKKYFLKTLELAVSRGIKVVLYESPVLKDAIQFQPNRHLIIDEINEMAKSKGVPFVQFQDWPLAGDRKYFVSTLNLNMEGVKAFNSFFASRVREVIMPKESK